MENLIEIQIEIEKLQKQAEDIKAREFDRTVRDIRAKMAAFSISIKDIQVKKLAKPLNEKSRKAVGSRRSPSKTLGTKVPPKYRGPMGEVWTGRGVMPRWLSALLAEGRAKEEFLISR